jgi:DNA-directed RNA polymerase specialized sigma24 family protein
MNSAMRLILPDPPKGSEQSLESTLSAKYPWILRWAMHFTQNNRVSAEDLVQETFVRVLSVRDSIYDVGNMEPLLYTHLRFAYLTERRRNHLLQNLATADFDTLAINLGKFSASDQIDVQNQLRKVLCFLLWRRRSAKFAGIFLLRFFHGFAPEETARMCLITRHAVDLSLGYARDELKAYLANPHQVQLMGRGAAPEHKPVNVAVPSADFSSELLGAIFTSPCGTCPNDANLERRYRAPNHMPLETELVAHIVSCKGCIEKVRRFSGAEPPTRFTGEFPGRYRRHAKARRSEPTQDKEALARIFTRCSERQREIFEHRPRKLSVALNAEIAAVRDVASVRTVLEVETRSIDSLKMIEVFGEEGLLLLALPITERPPYSLQEMRSAVTLSGTRTLDVNLIFTVNGASIEVTYFDPHFTSDSLEELETVTIDSDLCERVNMAVKEVTEVEDHSESAAPPPCRRSWHRLFARVQRAFRLFHRRSLIFAAATALVVGIMVWVSATSRVKEQQVASLLADSMRAERGQRIAYGPGVIHQRVQIHASGQRHRLDLYRDTDGHRRPKTQPIDNDERQLRAKVAEAGLDWNDPLSASGFDAWLHQSAGTKDLLERTGDNFVVVTGTASRSPALRESLTLRLSDLHPVARSVQFVNQENLEITELSYEVVPWNPQNERLFEPLSGASSPAISDSSRHLLSPHSGVSENELDIAELDVMLALEELHADTERLQSKRTDEGIVVTGIVDSETRKQEIASRLRMISYAISDIHSYRDFESGKQPSSVTTAVKAESVVTEPTPLDGYCETKLIARDHCQQLAYSLLTSSAILYRETSQLDDLWRQYPPAKPLTPAAGTLLNQLVSQHLDHLDFGVRQQREALLALGLDHLETGMNQQDGRFDLHAATRQNLVLAKELVYPQNDQTRAATAIVQELAASVEEIRNAVSRLRMSTADEAGPSVSPPHPD